MNKYGKTYWGQAWLNALNHIDYSNRLPRGRSYASRGAVLDIKRSGTQIEAAVAGSRPSPYSVTIGVPEFDAKRKERITEILASHPAFLASLLNRELPEELLNITKNEGIALFPSRWDDLFMSCSCPDWAVPCKHLAAVIYMMAGQIDLNPLIVLEMHGYDAAEELNRKNIDIYGDISESTVSLEDLIEPFERNKALLTDDNAESEWSAPDLSVLPEVGGQYLDLLPDSPVFYHKNIKKELVKEIRQVRKQCDRMLSEQDIPDLPLHTVIDARIHLNPQFSDPTAVLTFEDDEVELPLIALLAALHRLEDHTAEALSRPLYLIYTCFEIARNILTKGLIVPNLMKAGTSWMIHWQPISWNKHLNTILNELEQALPPGIVTIAARDEEIKMLSAGHRTFYFTAVIITEIVNAILSNRNGTIRGDDIAALFLNGAQVVEGKQVTHEQLNSIRLWLKKLHVANNRLVPVIQVEENWDTHEAPFLLSIQILDRENGSMFPWHTFNRKPEYSDRRIGVLKDLMSLQEYVPDLGVLVNADNKTHLEYNSDAFEEVLLELIPVLQLLGIEVMLPKSLKHLVKPAPTVQVDKTSSGESNGWMSLEDLLTFNWKVAIGDEILDEDEFMRLVKGNSGIVRIRDQYIHLREDDLQKLKKRLQNPPKLKRSDLLRMLISEEYNGSTIKLSEEVQQVRQEWMSIQDVAKPDALKATLRPYQQRGFQWLYKNSRIGFGSILADDMGLGKTLQAIALIIKIKEEGWLSHQKRVLIVVPTSLITNWNHEIQRFAPSLQVGVHHGAGRSLDDLENCDICITSYGTARSDAKKLAKRAWAMLIIDEAQNIKNPGTNQTKAIKRISSDVRIALSGTPVENRLSEYWSIFDFINKGYLGSRNYFLREFARPIQRERNQQKLKSFHKLTSPFILRRLKTDKNIIQDLPEKIENDVYCSLTGKQAALYENAVSQAMDDVRNAEGIDRRGLVLKMMTGLKQICNHPSQYSRSKKLEFTDSGKWNMLTELLRPTLDRNDKVLIFTQYRQMGDLMVKGLEQVFGEQPLFLHGGVSRKNRDEMVHAFQNYRHHRLFIFSLKAGGTGLNLTAASNVIHYDRWWNPAVETQATDRAYRIGQNKNVMVYRMITEGTLEEKIDAMIRSKKELADLTVATGETWMGELSNDDLQDLVRLSSNVEV